MTKEIRDRILEARDEMELNELFNFLRNLESDNLIDEMNHENVDIVEDFAKRLAEDLRDMLNDEQWPAYEIGALKKLDDMPNDYDDVIWIDSYGFPRKIRDNVHLLELVGLWELSGVELEDDEN